MKSFFRTLNNDLIRSFISIEFALAVLGVYMVFYIGAWSELKFAPDILYLFRYAKEAGTFDIIFILVSIIPYTTCFCSEWNNQYIKPVIIRAGIRQYTISKIFTCAISAGCAYVFGMIIFVVSLKIRLPVISVNSDLNPYIRTLGGEFLMDRRYFLYFAIYCMLGFLTAALWSAVGLYASSYLPNKYVALFTPFITYYVLNLFTSKFPIWLRLNRISQGRCVIGGIGSSLGYAILLHLLIIMIIAFLFSRKVKGRLENG